MDLDPIIPVVCSLVLSYVFVVASFHKWQNLDEFRETLTNYQVLPESLPGMFVYLVPAMETVCGIALLVPYTAPFAALMAAVLLLVYMFAIGVNLLKGRRSIDCGCGGSGQKQAISEWLIVRNGVLVIFAWAVMTAIPSRETGWLDWLVALLATATGCLIYNIVNQLLVNRDLLKVFRNHG